MFQAALLALKKYPALIYSVMFVIIMLIMVLVVRNYKEQINTLHNQIQLVHNNELAALDSVHTLFTKNGELSYKYAFLQNNLDSLTKDNFYKGKQIYTLQNTVTDLRLKLQGGTITVVTKSDTAVDGGFYNTYRDTGLFAELWDTVSFIRLSPLNWKGTNKPSFSAQIKLQNTVGRNADGTFYGAIQTFSPMLHITDVITIVNDKFAQPVVTKVRNTFAIGASLDNHTLATGLRLRLGEWQLGAEYVIINDTNLQLNGIIDRLRLNTYYFLF